MPTNGDRWAVWLSAADTATLRSRLGPTGIAGGAVYDALVGEAARRHGARLLTRDRGAQRSYDLLGVDDELVGL